MRGLLYSNFGCILIGFGILGTCSSLLTQQVCRHMSRDRLQFILLASNMAEFNQQIWQIIGQTSQQRQQYFSIKIYHFYGPETKKSCGFESTKINADVDYLRCEIVKGLAMYQRTRKGKFSNGRLCQKSQHVVSTDLTAQLLYFNYYKKDYDSGFYEVYMYKALKR